MTEGGLSMALTPRSSPAIPSSVPSYALDYAPLVWLDVEENYFPSDMAAQLTNTQPELNYTVITTGPSPLTLDNLNSLNPNDEDVYLTSIDDISTNPAWLNGTVPDGSGQTEGAVSSVIVSVDKGSGEVDVFYFYFYAYNKGDIVLKQELGDHVGDWEHNMIRFQDGTPQTVWFSQHSFGEAFTYDIVQKQGQRVIDFSARGTHANYAINGTHDHTIPDLNLDGGLIDDYTSQGTLWDPTLSAYYYSYDNSTGVFTPYDSSSPVNYLYYLGQWGDDQYPSSDPRQKEFFGFYKYTAGPTGPIDKKLGRTDVCPPSSDACIIRTELGP
ncbi:MAG: hypothetical protein M1819_003678 [Sarea resinae]|nr:MAG: hypothetical protein M1819_003678 [Sarea resinae]